MTVAQDANQLALVGEPRFEACDGVGVDVARNNDLLPRGPRVFLSEKNRTIFREEACCVFVLLQAVTSPSKEKKLREREKNAFEEKKKRNLQKNFKASCRLAKQSFPTLRHQPHFILNISLVTTNFS